MFNSFLLIYFNQLIHSDLLISKRKNGKREVQIFNTFNGAFIRTFNLESIDTGNNDNDIYSIQFSKANQSQEILLVSGNSILGCQIYQKNNSSETTTFKLQNSLKFEDSSNHNCCLIKGKYLFAMA